MGPVSPCLLWMRTLEMSSASLCGVPNAAEKVFALWKLLLSVCFRCLCSEVTFIKVTPRPRFQLAACGAQSSLNPPESESAFRPGAHRPFSQENALTTREHILTNVGLCLGSTLAPSSPLRSISRPVLNMWPQPQCFQLGFILQSLCWIFGVSPLS